ncbi:MAG: hypothetical protein M3O71_16930 [Bacteroidota bacterium]|nr:hypothetical protein [Bacteroidota bacterium]
MGNNLKALIKKLALFILLLIVLDYTTGTVLKYFYFKHDSIIGNTTTYVTNYADQQLLVVGSSHAVHHYIAKQLADSVHFSSYNTGARGNYLLYSYAMLKCILQRYTPKIIILDIRADEFSVNPAGYDHLSSLLPYYDQHPEIRSIINQRSVFEKIKVLSKTYQFNSQLFSIINRNIYKNKTEFKADSLLGFIPLTDTIKTVFKGNYYTDIAIDQNYVNVYKSFLTECLKRHVKVFVFISPVLPKLRSNTRTSQIAAKVANEVHVPFFDFSNDDRFKNRVYFFDDEHLNINGAKVYTSVIIEKIKPSSVR